MNNKKRILLLLAVVLITGLGISCYCYFKKKQGKKAQAIDTYVSKEILPGDPLTEEDQVKALFRELLGREADPGGLSYWTTILQNSSYENVRNQLLNSPEYKSRQIA